MTNKLRQYFPMIHTRQEVLAEIEAKPKLKQEFYSWGKKYRKEFLDFCTGVKGVKIMYDFISKEILNPEIVPNERLKCRCRCRCSRKPKPRRRMNRRRPSRKR